MTLPPPLLTHTGIEKEVVVVGVGDHLEVWSKERWQEQQEALDARDRGGDGAPWPSFLT